MKSKIVPAWLNMNVKGQELETPTDTSRVRGSSTPSPLANPGGISSDEREKITRLEDTLNELVPRTLEEWARYRQKKGERK